MALTGTGVVSSRCGRLVVKEETWITTGTVVGRSPVTSFALVLTNDTSCMIEIVALDTLGTIMDSPLEAL
jgi:hypothetical protein